jgi:predicted small metal-binding protein
VPGCKFTVRTDNEAELLARVAKHTAMAHGIQEFTPDLTARVKAATQELPKR